MTQLMIEIVGVWLVVILLGMPLFAAMGLAAFAFVLLGGLSGSIVPQKMAQAMNSFPLVAAPLFILMGSILGAARLTDRIVRFATSLVGALRGGYAHASILSSMIFAGMVGSAVADAAGTGAVEVRVTCRKSKLYHSDAVAERVLSAIASTASPKLELRAGSFESDDGESGELDEARATAQDSPQLFIVRIVNDQCEISADSSGELLHRRGYRKEIAKAPLRETLAAAMVLASGWDGRRGEPLLDRKSVV